MKLLIKHLASVKSNSFVIAERVSPTPFAFTPPAKRIGEGLAAKHSFINHSCNPNAAEVTRRRNQLIYALRPIQKGEQVNEYNYTFSTSISLSSPSVFYILNKPYVCN